jgi:hypothetical protein
MKVNALNRQIEKLIKELINYESKKPSIGKYLSIGRRKGLLKRIKDS